MIAKGKDGLKLLLMLKVIVIDIRAAAQPFVSKM